ncbi:MAG TPA: hypothetical protein VHR45_23555 [Thermoanaerobaculia bacterium]|nr:hypothetical protein [Thermoanaerobaculia bacterium]
MQLEPRHAIAILTLASISLAAAAFAIDRQGAGMDTAGKFFRYPCPESSKPTCFPLLVPTGSYMLSCSRCQFLSRSQYQCQCKKIDGAYRSAQIDLGSCAASEGFNVLANLDGYLVCK